jgi:hypothetical protein
MVDGLWVNTNGHFTPSRIAASFLTSPGSDYHQRTLRPMPSRGLFTKGCGRRIPRNLMYILSIPGCSVSSKDKLADVKAAVLNPFHVLHANTNSRFLQVQPPKTAYARAFEALDRLEKEFGAWRDFVEVARGLQRSLLELLAFADWWHDIQQGEDFHTSISCPHSRGDF